MRAPDRLGHVLTVSFPAAAMGTNCYVFARERGSECVVVDPGIGVTDQLFEVLGELDLKPTAVLLTHGHLDHTFSVTPVCGGQMAAHIHADDRYRLVNPYDQLGPQLRGMLEQSFGKSATWREPEKVVSIHEGEPLELAGLTFGVTHAPGHTEGSVMFTVDEVPDGLDDAVAATVNQSVITGDVLFAGSIGRTDLEGGSDAAMQQSLRTKVLPLPDSSLILPGHGPASTMARERVSNPYLQALQGSGA